MWDTLVKSEGLRHPLDSKPRALPADLQETVGRLRNADTEKSTLVCPYTFTDVYGSDGKPANIPGILTLHDGTLVFQPHLKTAHSASTQPVGEGGAAKRNIGGKEPADSGRPDNPMFQPKPDEIPLSQDDGMRIATIGYLMTAVHPEQPCEIRWTTGTLGSPTGTARFGPRQDLLPAPVGFATRHRGAGERGKPAGDSGEPENPTNKRPTLVTVTERPERMACIENAMITDLRDLNPNTLPAFWEAAETTGDDTGFLIALDADPTDFVGHSSTRPGTQAKHIEGSLHFSSDPDERMRTVTYYPPENTSEHAMSGPSDVLNAVVLCRLMGIPEIQVYDSKKGTTRVLRPPAG